MAKPHDLHLKQLEAEAAQIRHVLRYHSGSRWTRSNTYRYAKQDQARLDKEIRALKLAEIKRLARSL